MSHSEVIIEVDGVITKTIQCSGVNIAFASDAIVLKISSGEVVGDEDGGAPAADGFAMPEPSEKFQLVGDDLESFNLLSEFRLEHSKTDKISGVEPNAVTIESEAYSIQDLSAIQNASLDLITKERKFLDDGFLVHSFSAPRYDYESENYFKLIETAVLYKAEEAVTSVED